MSRQTHSYATLLVSEATYNEIASKLKAAGYDHAFGQDGAIDMHGIGLTTEPTVCEHGVPDKEFCSRCSAAYRRARIDNCLCEHDRMNEDGICCMCGKDCREIG